MPTLKEKKLLNEHVTAETKRCLGLVLRQLKGWYRDYETAEGEAAELGLKDLATEIIENCPYLEFHPELRKKIPK